ncbi:MAG: hypothetical protein PX481_17595 [Microcystis sp. M53603_WE2]|uniref:DUF7305 domain-containing protein n=1 Tax=Microcystis aeruginosa PCC 9717 TaxID=1160286 RepID=I4FNF4_MICAE|nr:MULTISPECIES: hypothetical protein [Microcystis]MCE2663618.1 hypothetical protein [Microcystis sp. 53602_E8]MDJ0546278.1 hypothetical protein [Microcystis sp. M53601_WE4]MDJ0548731.1 hypothetical protein [Microcystis sp. M49637_WE12]MDJ0540455.1 hypothetical protein [Microcystis sp. M53603_WE2]MDJ0603251.1 hypothetical protein [Microcystis sp. M53602_WE12]
MNNRLCLHLMANKEKGFALPLAVLIGLILMVTGMTMIMRAQGDQSKVIAQKARADSLTSSEVGLARVQDLLNSVRVMATVDRNCTSGDCWQNARYDVDTDPTDLQKHLKKLVDAAPSCSNPNDAVTLKKKINELRDLSADKWVDLGNNSYYRVVEYNYRIDTGMGVLTLEGLSRKSAATDITNITIDRDSDDNAASRNRVVVTIPILDAPHHAFNRTTVPALWISEGTVEGDAIFQGDVVEKVESPECNINQTKIQQPTPALNPPYTAQFVGVFFPNLPETPTGIPSLGDLTSSETFPRTGDTASPSGVYEYIFDDIDLDDGEKITITAGDRVVFYVKGNINGAIEHDCGSVTGCKPGNLQIYADNGLGSANPQICLKGNQTLQAFIFAPDYSLGKTDNGTFIGAAWGKNWGQISGCLSSSGAVAVTQGVEWTELIYDLKPQFPRLGQIANWCEEPIDTLPGESMCDYFPTASPSPSP